MNTKSDSNLATEQLSVWNAFRICSVPLRLTRTLIGELLEHFAPHIDVKQFWQMADVHGLLLRRAEDEWRFDYQVRQNLLDELEREDPTLAQQIHIQVLDYLNTTVYPTPDEDQDQLQRAYHTTPSDQNAGAVLYWSVYCRARASNRVALLPVLAHLAESQANWLTDHKQDTKLYHAAALYYEETVESRQRSAELLESILEQGASVPITIDASFLLGMFKEQTNRHDEAAKLYEQATKLREKLDLKDEDLDVQRHLRRTLSRSLSNLASILQTKGGPQALEVAENYYRHGVQIASAVGPAFEATQRRGLIEIQQRRGEEEDKVQNSIQRISQIEGPFRLAFLEDALSRSDDIGYLYYAISALNHGLGYERQQIHIKVDQHGASRLEGTYTLSAFSSLSQIDTYIETVPESGIGVHFENLECLTPAFTLNFKHERNAKNDPASERLKITIDPPMQPGDQLTYRWTAWSDDNTFATTTQLLEQAGLDYEYAFWDIIAPIKQLEMRVFIPATQRRPSPPTWFELWRVGPWPAQTQQTQTAYLARKKDEPSRVSWRVEPKPPDQILLSLDVNYPWLAMRYVLAWDVIE
jgi:hypothetical protein